MLEQYRDLHKEIIALDQRIKKLNIQKRARVADTVTGSSPEPPYASHIIPISGYNDGRKTAKRIMQLEAIRENRMARLLDLEVTIEEYIDSLNDSQLRLIIGYRYIDGYAWRKVARLIGHPNFDEQYPRRIVDRYFKRCTTCTKNSC